MTRIDEMTLREFAEDLSSGKATPGGGSAAAYCGAISASLTAMVCNLTVGNKGFENATPELKRIRDDAIVLRDRLLALSDEDSKAYEEVVRAYRTDPSTIEEEERLEMIQAALKKCTEVPFEVMELSLEALKLASMVAKKGNPRAISDVGVAALAASMALRGANLNVRINLSEIEDREYRNRLIPRLKRLEQAADEIESRTMRQIFIRL